SNVVLPAEEAEELARIALVSLEAEPVAKIIAHYPLGVDVGKQKFVQAIGELPDFGGYLFSAPPAPGVPEEATPENVEMLSGYVSTYKLTDSERDIAAEIWNACRTAMLQSGNFRENKNSSTNNFREIAETSTNYPAIPSEVLSAILKVARIRADFDDFDGDRRGIGDCLDEAEQELIVTINKYASQLAAEPIAPNDVREQTAIPQVPVTPDGWISCSERMPPQDDWILIYSKHGEYMAGKVQGEYVELSDGTLSWLGNVLFWMPLPEPPKGAK
ncbi:TPA: DUF551 domain-containing protein, partial [Escherichia coli]|nr:DUF551 domain-containing protein [Escherichia coli]